MWALGSERRSVGRTRPPHRLAARAVTDGSVWPIRRGPNSGTQARLRRRCRMSTKEGSCVSGGFGVPVGGCMLRIIAAVLTAGLVIALVAGVLLGAADPT